MVIDCIVIYVTCKSLCFTLDWGLHVSYEVTKRLEKNVPLWCFTNQINVTKDYLTLNANWMINGMICLQHVFGFPVRRTVAMIIY